MAVHNLRMPPNQGNSLDRFQNKWIEGLRETQKQREVSIERQTWLCGQGKEEVRMKGPSDSAAGISVNVCVCVCVCVWVCECVLMC